MTIKITPGSVVSKGHVVLTGPITGTVTLDDGTTYDVSAVAIEVPDEHAAEVAHLIGQRYADEGHPTDPDFTYDASTYKAAKRSKKG